jgi:hypothetical protein
MKRYTIVKLIGWAIGTMITLVLISFLEVAVYSYLINPGQPESAYHAHAQASAPFISGIFGFLLFFLIVRYWKKKGEENLPRLALLFPLTYVVLDLIILISAGAFNEPGFLPTFLLANGAKFMGSYLGYRASV